MEKKFKLMSIKKTKMENNLCNYFINFCLFLCNMGILFQSKKYYKKIKKQEKTIKLCKRVQNTGCFEKCSMNSNIQVLRFSSNESVGYMYVFIFCLSILIIIEVENVKKIFFKRKINDRHAYNVNSTLWRYNSVARYIIKYTIHCELVYNIFHYVQ